MCFFYDILLSQIFSFAISLLLIGFAKSNFIFMFFFGLIEHLSAEIGKNENFKLKKNTHADYFLSKTGYNKALKKITIFNKN